MQFHVVSFEGPDGYARAGGLATRVDGLTRALASLGFETHLWFVGDPDQPGHDAREGVRLHRWCQWISARHRGGVYDGEEGKRKDFSGSLPAFLVDQVLGPHLRRGGEAAVLAEEWHTAEAVIETDRRLREAGLRDRVSLLWNANNLFGFDHVPWDRLRAAAVLTTVSRSMRLRMESMGLRPLVLPNGLPPEAYVLPDRALSAEIEGHLQRRLALAKVARWDPDKSWLGAVEALRLLRDQGRRPLLVARGGAESHEAEVRAACARADLRWVDCESEASGPAALLDAIGKAEEADLLCLRFHVDSKTLRALYRAVACVLANSRFEPFGLVGLETMAVGGVACTGFSGEDYVVPGRNALVLQTDDPRELIAILHWLREHPQEEAMLRRAARATALQYAWAEIVRRILLPRLALLRRP